MFSIPVVCRCWFQSGSRERSNWPLYWSRNMPMELTMRGLCSWTRAWCRRVTSAWISRRSPPQTINDRGWVAPAEADAEAEVSSSSVTVATSRQTSARSVPYPPPPPPPPAPPLPTPRRPALPVGSTVTQINQTNQTQQQTLPRNHQIRTSFRKLLHCVSSEL